MGIPRSRWENNIKMDFKETGRYGVARDSSDSVNAEMKLFDRRGGGVPLTSGGRWRRTVLHQVSYLVSSLVS